MRRDAYKLHLKAIISLRARQTSQALVHLFVRSPDPAALMSVESRLNRVYFHFFTDYNWISWLLGLGSSLSIQYPRFTICYYYSFMYFSWERVCIHMQIYMLENRDELRIISSRDDRVKRRSMGFSILFFPYLESISFWYIIMLECIKRNKRRKRQLYILFLIIIIIS